MGDEKKYRVVETDNFGVDHLNESFAGPRMSRIDALGVAEIFNKAAGLHCLRRWKVELDGYELQPGFEP